LLTATVSFGNINLSPETADRVQTGIHQLYNLNFDQAETIFTQVATTTSNHPIGCVYLALTSITRSLSKGTTPEDTAKFHTYTEMAKSYSEGKRQNYIDSLRWLKRGVSQINRACKISQTSADAKLLLGSYQYFTSRLPWYFRFFASLLVEPANRNTGIENLEYAVSHSKFGRVESEMLLAIAYSWDDQPDAALILAENLSIKLPENYCLGFLKQEILLRQYKYKQALNCASNQLIKIEFDKRNDISGLLANQHYMLGLIYTRTKNYDPALKNFALAFNLSENKPFLKAWAILRQGTVYDLKRQRSQARNCYAVVKTIPVVAVTLHESDLLDAYGRKFADVPYRGEQLD